MKKIGMKILSVILVMSLLIGGTASMTTASAADIGKTLENAGLGIIEVIFTTLVGGLNAIVPDSKDFVKVSDRVLENFYEGTETWEDEAKADAWALQAQFEYAYIGAGTHAIVAEIMLENGKVPETLTVEAIANEVIISVLGVSCC